MRLNIIDNIILEYYFGYFIRNLVGYKLEIYVYIIENDFFNDLGDRSFVYILC